jgi:hypothetical protein
MLCAHGADPHEQGVGAQLPERELGEVAERRVHAGSHDATQHDELDAGPVEQGGCDVEGVGDDGEAPVGEAPRQLQRGRSARDRDRLAVLDEVRSGGGDRPLRGQPGVGRGRPARRGRRGCGAAIRPDEGAVVREPPQVAADRGRGDAEVARQDLDARVAVLAQPGNKLCPAINAQHERDRAQYGADCQVALCTLRDRPLASAQVAR